MSGEGTVAVRAEAAAIVLSAVRVNAQARMLIRMEWAKIQPASSGGSGSVVSDEILYVMDLVVPSDGDSVAVP